MNLFCRFAAQRRPCGENGEFHTFVFDGPVFQTPIRFVTGEKVLRDGFLFLRFIAAVKSA
jgi:diphthamide synthase (EF-2-diphthine--ammonia ligase)